MYVVDVIILIPRWVLEFSDEGGGLQIDSSRYFADAVANSRKWVVLQLECFEREAIPHRERKKAYYEMWQTSWLLCSPLWTPNQLREDNIKMAWNTA